MGIGFQMGKILWDEKFCEMSSHSVSYGMYGSHNILDGVLLVSHFQHWQKKTQKTNILHHIYILQSFWFHLHDL